MKRGFLFLIITGMLLACDQQENKIEITPKDYHNAVDKLTEIIVHDIFSPVVASRIYAYPSIAAYEIIAKKGDKYKSVEGQMKDYSPTPAPTSDRVNLDLAALIAYMDVGRTLIFSEDKMVSYQDSLYKVWEGQNKKVFEESKTYGLLVAQHVKDWMDGDNYKQTRTMPKFTVKSDEVSRWQPTPPLYMDGIEPHWSKIRTFVLDSAAQFKTKPHPAFDMKENSVFQKEVQEVYKLGGGGPEREGEEVEIAKFWDCNPYMSTTKGHLMFAVKKISPGGHWIGICKIACEKSNADFDKTVYAYAKVSAAMFDGFISCWEEKYDSNLIRPETLINKTMDENWFPVLQTPPFRNTQVDIRWYLEQLQ
ncbi:MAG: phosphatidic acid phosphatase [Flavobacteriaceae bacterium]|nr:phosphatidic acid phosphatase [Flavobacteriaceae bacterium]